LITLSSQKYLSGTSKEPQLSSFFMSKPLDRQYHPLYADMITYDYLTGSEPLSYIFFIPVFARPSRYVGPTG
jgi:hypothetical protein